MKFEPGNWKGQFGINAYGGLRKGQGYEFVANLWLSAEDLLALLGNLTRKDDFEVEFGHRGTGTAKKSFHLSRKSALDGKSVKYNAAITSAAQSIGCAVLPMQILQLELLIVEQILHSYPHWTCAALLQRCIWHANH